MNGYVMRNEDHPETWFWPNVLLAATVLVGLLTVGWCVWQAVQTW